MAKSPSIPKGTRDFSPTEMRKRSYVFSKIREAFEKYGFEEISTPAMENIDTLTGKYGDEGDQLIFKVINSGDYLSKASIDSSTTSKSLSNQISEKALRYDLTIPFARYVVQNRNDITFPFRRCQIQNVWRADRPQKGRFREFYQCDADIIGTDSLIAEIELIQLYDDVFESLGLKNITVKVNNRKILSGLTEVIGESDKFREITIALDKLDKIGVDKVKIELLAKGISQEALQKLDFIFSMEGQAIEKLNQLKAVLVDSKVGSEGINELSYIIENLGDLGTKVVNLDFDVTLARGLDYYTGAIIEVISDDVQIGSIGGGGRYDDLTANFGLSGISGVGVSFGFDRICIALEELSLFPQNTSQNPELLFVNFGDKESKYCLKLLKQLRDEGIKSELYPKADKLKKQMQYANKKGFKKVVLVGESELKSKILTVKNMFDGSQKNMTFEELKTLKIKKL